MVLVGMFMENLEQAAMSSPPPPSVKPKMWKLYIDDSFMVVREQRDALTDHLNNMDSMGVLSSQVSQRPRVAFFS